MDGKWLYYAKLGANGLFRIPAAGGPETNILPSLPSSLWGGWALAEGKMIFAALPGESREPIDQLVFNGDRLALLIRH